MNYPIISINSQIKGLKDGIKYENSPYEVQERIRCRMAGCRNPSFKEKAAIIGILRCNADDVMQ